MKLLLLPFFIFFANLDLKAQLELSIGYGQRGGADGISLYAAYNFPLTPKLYTKTQLGYKQLYQGAKTLVPGASIKIRTWELHQLLSWQAVQNKKYTFNPAIGISYRLSKWKGEMKPPLDQNPIRYAAIYKRNGDLFEIVSISGLNYQEYSFNAFGYSLQLQSQFRLSYKTSLLITPFLESDFDWFQTVVGCYVGIAYKFNK